MKSCISFLITDIQVGFHPQEVTKCRFGRCVMQGGGSRPRTDWSRSQRASLFLHRVTTMADWRFQPCGDRCRRRLFRARKSSMGIFILERQEFFCRGRREVWSQRHARIFEKEEWGIVENLSLYRQFFLCWGKFAFFCLSGRVLIFEIQWGWIRWRKSFSDEGEDLSLLKDVVVEFLRCLERLLRAKVFSGSPIRCSQWFDNCGRFVLQASKWKRGQWFLVRR